MLIWKRECGPLSPSRMKYFHMLKNNFVISTNGNGNGKKAPAWCSFSKFYILQKAKKKDCTNNNNDLILMNLMLEINNLYSHLFFVH